MERSVAASRPQITIVNGTRHAVWVAMYKRSPLRTDESPVAWQIVSPPPRGKTAIFIPREYQVCARYSFDPGNPCRPVYQTNCLQVPRLTSGASFVIEGVSTPDRRAWGAVTRAAATGSPGMDQIRIVNRFSIGVWSHVRQNGRDIFPPGILPPESALLEDLSSSFYVAVLPLPREVGDLLLDSEIPLTEIAVRAGESVKIQGGPYRGFKISKILDRDSSLATEPKKQTKARDRSKAAAKKSVKKVTKKSESRRRERGIKKDRQAHKQVPGVGERETEG